MHQEFYRDSDLKIGEVINVWGRKILLCDCDEFTKDYYRTKYGIGKLWYLSFPYKHFYTSEFDRTVVEFYYWQNLFIKTFSNNNLL